MTIKKLTYIGLALLAAFLPACNDDVTVPNTLSEDGTKTPISVTALLDAGGSTTRAADKEFADGDKLLAYLRHVTWNGGFTTDAADKRQVVNVDQAPRLVTFTCTGSTTWDDEKDDILPFITDETIAITGKGEHPDTKQATGLTASYTNTASETVNALYWDDFSVGGKGDATDIRTPGHYLQSYYGYCYNGSPAYGQTGSHITSDLVAATGVLGWQVSTNQNDGTVKSAFKTSDLLWSAEQTPIEYAHVDGEGKKNHGTLVLPYTHAMSKVTIKVTLHESFGDGVAFNGVTTTLLEMFTHCTCTAPTYTLTNKSTATDIIMWNEKSSNSSATKECTFEAIVVPSILSVVNNFATIEGLDGNKYVIPITEAMLQVATTANGNKGWGAQLTETNENINNGTAQAPGHTRAGESKEIPLGKGYEMKSGVNYVLNVNISKQQITVSALIKDWIDVNAKGTALVQFNPDVNGKGDIANELKEKGGFDVYKNSVNTAFTDKTTTLSWDNTNSKWTYNPVIYWAGQTDEAYFRALWPANTTTSMSQNNDVLWGYACNDDANNGSKVGTNDEVAITPRTGDVPLHFLHPMSKISVKLETATGDPASASSPAVDLTAATIEISNLSTSGTLSLVDGTIDPAQTKTTSAITGTYSTSGTTSISNLPVIPQTIGDDAILKVTLKDGTAYKLKLNTCFVDDNDDDDDNNVKIAAWERNKHYTYTIQVDKEAITFRAMVKDWDPVSGSGNANLEWD